MEERQLYNWMIQNNLSFLDEVPLEQKIHTLERVMRYVIKPKDKSDRTTQRRIAEWVKMKIEIKQMGEIELFRRMVDYLLESTSEGVRNPMAVFITILKKEHGYGKLS